MTESHEKAIAATNSDRQTKTFSEHHSNISDKVSPQQLLEDLEELPDNWALVAVGKNKAPIGNNWQNTPLTKRDFKAAVQVGRFECLTVKKDEKTFHPTVSWFRAVGVLCGPLSGGLLFLDHDGASCDRLIQQVSEQSLEEALPKTISVTSGREGRYQSIYRVPERYWGAISTQKLQTGTNGEGGKPEL